MDTSPNSKTMNMMGVWLFLKGIRKVTSQKWSRIIIRSFWVILWIKFTIKMSPQIPQTPKLQCSRNCVEYPWENGFPGPLKPQIWFFQHSIASDWHKAPSRLLMLAVGWLGNEIVLKRGLQKIMEKLGFGGLGVWGHVYCKFQEKISPKAP